MKCAGRVALGIAGGYFLGRTKKLKLAMMLGGAVAGRRAGGPSGLLAQGGKLLGGSPELTRLADELRGRLLEAGKGAAVAVATRQVESLADRVSSRIEGLASARPKMPGESSEKESPADPEPDEPAPAEELSDEDTGDENARHPSREQRSRNQGAKNRNSSQERPARETPRRAGTGKPSSAAGTATRASGRASASARDAGRAVSGVAKAARPARPRRGEGNG